MRTVTNLIAGIIVATAALFSGAAYQNHKDTGAEQARNAVYAKQTISILGVVACGRLMGAVTVGGDGTLTSHNDMSGDAAMAISKTLPEANAGVVTIPCPQGAGSRLAPGQNET